MPKIILVTGGAGFIGSHLVDALLHQGHNVIIIDNFNDYYSPHIKHHNLLHLKTNSRLSIIKADIRDHQAVNSLFAHHAINLVIHLAARAGVRPSLENPTLYWDVNVMGTLNLLEAMRAYQVRRLIFASSSSVYGDRSKGPFPESLNTDHAVSPYGASKKAGEVLAHTYAHLYQIKTTCLRFFTVYGPRNRPDMAHFKFLHALMTDQPIIQYGDGTSGRDYTYIADIIAGILHVLKMDSRFDIYNLGNSSPVLLKDMIHTLEIVARKSALLTVKPMQPGDVFLTFADISKAATDFGYAPKTDYRQGIQNLYRWYLENQSLLSTHLT